MSGRWVSEEEIVEVELQLADAERDALINAAKGLARWTHHHSTCARTIEAGTCDCGLNDAWRQIQRLDGRR